MPKHKRFTQEMPTLKHRPPVSGHVFVDTESNWSQVIPRVDITTHTLRFGYAKFCEWSDGRLHERDTILFYERSKFWKWLHSLRHTGQIWVWAHNLAFDGTLLGLFNTLQEADCKLGHFTDCDLPAFFQCNIKEQAYQFLDSLNIFKQSLASIGQELGLAKMTMPAQTDSLEEWIPYCKRDVDILHSIVEKWTQLLDTHKLGRFMPSLAGQALTAYRTRFMASSIQIHCNDTVIALERGAYYGGLVEPKIIGNVPAATIYEYDVNSLYPYVMKKYKYPNCFMGFRRWPNKKITKELMDKFYCIAHVKIESTTGVFPYRDKCRLLFPLGTYWTALHHPELERAFALGVVKEVAMLAYYTKADLFSDYVDFFYKLRQEYTHKGERAFAACCKLLLNALYGKFGQKRPLWEDYSEELLREAELKGGLLEGELDFLKEHIECRDKYEMKLKHPYNNVTYGARRLLGKAQILIGEGESSWSFPAISGAVTSYAREYVRNIQSIIGRNNLYYTDTDSFFVNTKGKRILEKQGLTSETVLGKLKAKTVNDWMIIHGPKDYETSNEVKRKGIRMNAELLQQGIYSQEQWPGFKTLAREEFPTEVRVKKITKKLLRVLTTMRVGPSGWTHPLTLSKPSYKRIS